MDPRLRHALLGGLGPLPAVPAALPDGAAARETTPIAAAAIAGPMSFWGAGALVDRGIGIDKRAAFLQRDTGARLRGVLAALEATVVPTDPRYPGAAAGTVRVRDTRRLLQIGTGHSRWSFAIQLGILVVVAAVLWLYRV